MSSLGVRKVVVSDRFTDDKFWRVTLNRDWETPVISGTIQVGVSLETYGYSSDMGKDFNAWTLYRQVPFKGASLGG